MAISEEQPFIEELQPKDFNGTNPGGAELAELRRQVAEMSSFLETATIGLHRVGPDGKILWANQAELDLLGYSKEEYIGHHIAEFHADGPVIDEILRCLSRGERLRNHPARLKCRDGSIKSVLIDSSVLFQEGRFIHTQCFTRDVTEQQGVEDRLRRIEFIVNNAGWAVATIHSRSNEIEFCNEAFAKMHGYLREELIGMPLVKTFAPEWMRFWPEHLPHLTRGGDYIYESLHIRKDGQTFPVRTCATIFAGEDGRSIFRASVFTDISQEKLAHEALLKSEALKSAMLNSGLDAFIAIDSESRILEFNLAAEQIFGYQREEAIGRKLDELIIPRALREQHARGMRAYLATGETRILNKRIEIPAMRSDGSEFPCELTVVRVDREGPPVFTSFIRDISERKKTQAALDKAQAALQEHARSLEQMVTERTADLQSTIGELERFSYSLSHDMRAPLRAIHSFVQIVREEAGPQLSEEHRELLQKAVKAAGRLDKLIQDVLTYSKVGRDRIELQPIDAVSLIRQIIDERPEFRPPVTEIAIDCATPEVLGHEAHLTQIVTNLLGNAVKFVAPGVQPRIRITCETSHGRVRFSFEDNGVGIPSNARERIFGMFERWHNEAEYEGTGIGLAIARKAAERMNGTVRVDAVESGGSRFWIDLPAAL